MTMDRSKKQIEADISGLLARTGAEPYWLGGSGGGGTRRAGIGRAVVKPHARTIPTCTRCAQYHSTAEHDRHARGAKAKAKAKAKSKSRPKAKAKKVKKKAKSKKAKSKKAKARAKAKAKAKAKTKAPGWARS